MNGAIELTPRMVAQARTIAKGRRIRDVQRLTSTYGGRASKWSKKSSQPLEEDGRLFELHWYEHPEVGRVEIKIKEVEL